MLVSALSRKGGKKHDEDVGLNETDSSPTDASSNDADELFRKSDEYIAQSRAILLEANVSGKVVREAQELFKRAIHAHKQGDYRKAIELSLECIDLVDMELRNG